MQGREPAGLVVGCSGYMASHAAHRIAVRGPVLDHQPFHRVRVIARPRLGCIIKHPWIKTSTAAGAGLEEDIRELRRQSLI